MPSNQRSFVMKTNATCLLAAVLACGAASAQTQSTLNQPGLNQPGLNQPLNGQLNTQRNPSLNSQINNQVNTGSAGTPSVSGIGSTQGQALPPVAPLGQTGAAIGTPGVTAPLGTIDN